MRSKPNLMSTPLKVGIWAGGELKRLRYKNEDISAKKTPMACNRRLLLKITDHVVEYAGAYWHARPNDRLYSHGCHQPRTSISMGHSYKLVRSSMGGKLHNAKRAKLCELCFLVKLRTDLQYNLQTVSDTLVSFYYRGRL